jgi:hypothetical protein
MSGDLKAKLEAKVNPTYRAFLMQEIPKGEALLAQVKEDEPEYKAVIGPLSRMYLALNFQLGLMCRELNYPLNQSEWPDSKPLETLAQIYPGLQATNWYQYQLGEMMNQQNHLWTRIMTYEISP